MTRIVTAVIAVALAMVLGVAPSRAQNAYVTNSDDGTVTVIATGTNKVVGSPISVGSDNLPTGVAVTPDGSQVYVTDNDSNTVSVINTATNTVSTTITVGVAETTGPTGIAVTPDGKRVYVAVTNSADLPPGAKPGTVVVIDTATNKVTKKIHGFVFPYGVAVTPDGAHVYVTDESVDTVSVIDTSTNTVTKTIRDDSFGALTGVAVTPDGKKVYVANYDFEEGDTVSVIDTSTKRVSAVVTVGNGPIAFGNFIGPPILTVSETGDGRVTSNQCASGFAGGTSVTLTASANAGSMFSGWSGGGCSGTSSCVIDLTKDTTVSATFTVIPSFLLTVTDAGTGSGTVTSNPSGINCPDACSASFQSGTQVVLTAAPATGSAFSGWSGACSGTGTCTVTMSAAKSVTATFTALPPVTLTIAEAGTGAGLVTSNPPGINCSVSSNQCAAQFAAGTQVTLTASASAGSIFTGWSGGGCSGTNGCTLTLNANNTVTASFALNKANLTLLAAVLPTSRSIELGTAATAFATMINVGPANATSCTIAPATNVPASFVFQTTDPNTNALTGTANTPANIAAGQAQSFVIALTPTAAFAPTNVAFTFTCANAPSPAASIVGVNTLNLSASTTPVPDVVALAASADPGYVDIPGITGTGVFAVAAINLGIDATITVSANTGMANLPVSLTLCRTAPAGVLCLAPPAASVVLDFPPNATPAFGVFVAGSGFVADNPAVNRVFVTFTDSNGVLRGETSVAVRTQ
jgi:YVTN family beta-propeller protein